MVRVVLPFHLRTLAEVSGEVSLEIGGAVCAASVLDALEDRYPTLRGTVRDQQSGARRPFLRYFACGEDLSFDPDDAPLPDAVAEGREPFVIIGAISGGA